MHYSRKIHVRYKSLDKFFCVIDTDSTGNGDINSIFHFHFLSFPFDEFFIVNCWPWNEFHGDNANSYNNNSNNNYNENGNKNNL